MRTTTTYSWCVHHSSLLLHTFTSRRSLPSSPRQIQRAVADIVYHRSETKRKPLEEIAAAFGDKVVLVSETDVAAEESVIRDKVAALQVERAF